MTPENALPTRPWFAQLLQGVILAGVLWTANSVQSAHDAVIKLQTQMEQYQQNQRVLQERMGQLSAVSEQLGALNVRIANNEQRLSTLEQIRGHLR